MASPCWGTWSDEGCLVVDNIQTDHRKYKSTLYNAGSDWEASCRITPAGKVCSGLGQLPPAEVDRIPDKCLAYPTKLEGEIYIKDPRCGYIPPAEQPCWGTWSDEGCLIVEGVQLPQRKYKSTIYNAGPRSNWEAACRATPANKTCSNKLGSLPASEGNRFPDGCFSYETKAEGELYVDDTRCGYTPPSNPNAKPCFPTDEGEFGKLRPDIVNKFITKGDQFAIIFPNWVSRSGHTMLSASTENSLFTSTNVQPIQYPNTLANKYLFTFDNAGCSPVVDYLRYGDRINLISAAYPQRYINCAGLAPCTCSLGPYRGDCNVIRYETFRVISANATKIDGAPVCFNDLIYMQQTAEQNRYLSAADGGNVFCCRTEECKGPFGFNYLIRIVPNSGSIYFFPAEENPSQPLTTGTRLWIWYLIGGIILLVIVGIVLVFVFRKPKASGIKYVPIPPTSP